MNSPTDGYPAIFDAKTGLTTTFPEWPSGRFLDLSATGFATGETTNSGNSSALFFNGSAAIAVASGPGRAVSDTGLVAVVVRNGSTSFVEVWPSGTRYYGPNGTTLVDPSFVGPDGILAGRLFSASDTVEHGFVYSNGITRQPDTGSLFPGQSTVIVALDGHLAVGNASEPFVWNLATNEVVPLGKFSTSLNFHAATWINGNGLISGFSSGPGGANRTAWVHNSVKFIELPRLGGRTWAQVINEDNQILGFAELGAETHLVRWDPMPPPLIGDYNRNGIVEAGDYTVWRDLFGLLVEPGTGPDGNNNGFVDSFDRLIWRENFGDTNLEAAATSIPEPTAVGLAMVALIIGVRIRR